MILSTTPPKERELAACGSTCFALTVFFRFRCSHFTLLSRVLLCAVYSTCFLGGYLQFAVTRRFEAPADKLDKLEAVLRHATDHG